MKPPALAGAFAVLVAGWTTANPTLYRSGLALQCVTRNWPRWKVTLIAGALTTVLSCFPIVFLKLLDYVAIYGLLLIPIGAHRLHRALAAAAHRRGAIPGRKQRLAVNVAAAAVWLLTLAAVLPCRFTCFSNRRWPLLLP